MRVIFMGTPDFAVGTLEEIIKAGHEVDFLGFTWQDHGSADADDFVSDILQFHIMAP